MPSFEAANHTWSHRQSLWIKVQDEQGVVGQGEVTPLPQFSTETFEESRSYVLSLCSTGIDLGRSETVFEFWNAVESLALPPSVSCGLQMAVADLIGRTSKKPLHKLLSTQSKEGLSVAAVVTAGHKSWRGTTAHLAEKGYEHIKFKIGRDLRAELQELEAIRTNHPELCIRLDANASLLATDLLAFGERMAAFDPEFVEEPFAVGDDPMRLPFPVALDESLRTLDPSRVAGWLDDRRVQVLVLKPMVIGGPAICTRLAKLADAAGASVVFSHALDGPCSLALAAELSLSIPNAIEPGLAPHAGLSIWPTEKPASYFDTHLRSHNEVGLGLNLLELDHERA